MPVVRCIQSGKYLSGIFLVRGMSLGDIQGCVWSGKCLLRKCPSRKGLSGKCPLGICLVWEMSVRDMSRQRSVRRRCVWSGKGPSGMCLVGEISVGKVSVGEMSVWDVSGNPLIYPIFDFNNEINMSAIQVKAFLILGEPNLYLYHSRFCF